MKAFGVDFATWLLALSLAWTGGAAARNAADRESHKSSAWPSFCAIPPMPAGVRSASGFHAAVLSVRQAGQEVVAATAPDTFGLPLKGGVAFAESGRARAAPPPPINPHDAEQAEVFAREARAAAEPPARPH